MSFAYMNQKKRKRNVITINIFSYDHRVPCEGS